MLILHQFKVTTMGLKGKLVDLDLNRESTSLVSIHLNSWVMQVDFVKNSKRFF
jgi:hypothetical protein